MLYTLVPTLFLHSLTPRNWNKTVYTLILLHCQEHINLPYTSPSSLLNNSPPPFSLHHFHSNFPSFSTTVGFMRADYNTLKIDGPCTKTRPSIATPPPPPPPPPLKGHNNYTQRKRPKLSALQRYAKLKTMLTLPCQATN